MHLRDTSRGGPGGAMAEQEHYDLSEMREWLKRRSETLTPGEVAWCCDNTLRRYLVARKGVAAAAIAMLDASLVWRRGQVAPPLCCSLCDDTFASHCFWCVGLCKDRSVAVYGNPPRARNTDVPATMKHVMSFLEHAYNVAEGEGGVAEAGAAKWTWLVDFNGFGFTHAMQARIGISFAEAFGSHFPERLARLVLINPPTVFSLLLHAIQPFADARTLSKVRTVTGTPAEVSAALVGMGLFDTGHETLEWLHKTLSMPASPGNLPPFPSTAWRYNPHAESWTGWQGREEGRE